ALLRMQIDHAHAVFPQPVNAALEIHRLADDDGADVELPHQTAAIPARGQRCYHDLVAVAALPAGIAESVGFAMHRRVALLHAAVVTAARDATLRVGQAGADGNAALRMAELGLLDGYLQQFLEIHWVASAAFACIGLFFRYTTEEVPRQ